MSIKELNVQEVKSSLTSNSLFIDVRELDEYAEIHAKNTKHIPLAEVDEESVGIENKGKTIFIICRSGKRSMTACKRLSDQGFTDLVNVAGGTLAWAEAGLETE